MCLCVIRTSGFKNKMSIDELKYEREIEDKRISYAAHFQKKDYKTRGWNQRDEITRESASQQRNITRLQLVGVSLNTKSIAYHPSLSWKSSESLIFFFAFIIFIDKRKKLARKLILVKGRCFFSIFSTVQKLSEDWKKREQDFFLSNQ